MAAKPIIENIGKRERSKRYVMGTLLLLLAMGLSAFVIMKVPSPYVRAVVFVPYWFAWLCLFQASDRTCVFHVMRGTCSLDNSAGPVADPVLQAKLWTRAAMIYFKTTLAAIFWTALTVLLSMNQSGPANVAQ